MDLLIRTSLPATLSWSNWTRADQWHSNSTSRSTSKETQSTDLKEYIQPYVHCSVISNSQYLEAVQVPINRWVDKNDVMHLFHCGTMEYRLAVKKKKKKKKKEILPFATAWMDLESIIILSKISSQRKINTIDFIYTWNPMNKIN